MKTGFSLSFSKEDIFEKCDHDNDFMKAILGASYYVPNLNHELALLQNVGAVH